MILGLLEHRNGRYHRCWSKRAYFLPPAVQPSVRDSFHNTGGLVSLNSGLLYFPFFPNPGLFQTVAMVPIRRLFSFLWHTVNVAQSSTYIQLVCVYCSHVTTQQLSPNPLGRLAAFFFRRQNYSLHFEWASEFEIVTLGPTSGRPGRGDISSQHQNRADFLVAYILFCKYVLKRHLLLAKGGE